jgi:GTP cyclohydrolase I
MRTLPRILAELKERLAAESAHIEAAFPYFLEKIAPVSGAVGLMDYQCKFVGEANGSKSDFILSVCSRDEPLPLQQGNQRLWSPQSAGRESRLRCGAKALPIAGHPALIWIEELIAVAEASASAPVYALLKREDERLCHDASL